MMRVHSSVQTVNPSAPPSAARRQRSAAWSAQKTARIGMLLALATTLHLFEAQLPSLPIPGAKIGLANLVTLFVLYAWGLREALLVSVMRQIVGSFFTGTLFGPPFLFGLAGGILSVIVMAGTKRLIGRWTGPVPISLFGAAAHNVGQLFAAWALLGQVEIFYYLPYLLWFAIPSGLLVGATARHLLPFIPAIAAQPSQPRHRETRSAWAAAAVLALVGLLLTNSAFRPGDAAAAHTHAQVSVHGEVVALLPLDRDERHELAVTNGRMVIETSVGRVRIAESTCDHQVCVRTGWIDFTYQSIVCLPFQTIITLVSPDPDPPAYDAILY